MRIHPITIVLSLTLAGCPSDYGLEKTSDLRQLDCPHRQANLLLIVDDSALDACYGPGEWPYDLACLPGHSLCVIDEVTNVGVGMQDDCECLDDFYHPEGPPNADCCVLPDGWQSSIMGTVDYQNLGGIGYQQILLECPEAVLQTDIELVPAPEYEAMWSDDLCPQNGYTLAPNATKGLHIDPAHSWVTLETGTESITSPLTGGGGAATGPARFLTAAAWAADRTLDGTDYEGWHFWFHEPILLDTTSGTYTMDPIDPGVMKGTGTIDDVEAMLLLEMGEQASGTLGASSWTLEYTETVGADEITLHLEGAITNL